MKVAVVGLGAMGLGMATTLASKGFEVTGYDVAESSCKRANAARIAVASGLAEALAGQDAIVLSLPLAKHVAETVEGDSGVLASAKRGAVVIDTSTSEASVSRRLASLCASKGIGFLDAPVSGGPAGAKAGTMTMMIGGDAAHVETARPVLDAMAAKVLHVGASGAGNVAKLVNNLLVAVNLLTVSEAMRLSEAAGVPVDDVLKVVNAASGRSAVTEVNYPRWIQSGTFDSGFTMGLMRKDVRLAREMIGENGLTLPLAELAAKIWAESDGQLWDEMDFNQVVHL
ncbi:MAG: NAD(P)-dependent oxidoreductase [Beijerinckiaceae bacterium]